MGFRDGSGISWTIFKQSAPHCRQITRPTHHHSIFTDWMLFLMPNQQCQSTEGNQHTILIKWQHAVHQMNFIPDHIHSFVVCLYVCVLAHQWSLQKWLHWLKCCSGGKLVWARNCVWCGCTLAQPGEYDWTVNISSGAKTLCQVTLTTCLNLEAITPFRRQGVFQQWKNMWSIWQKHHNIEPFLCTVIHSHGT